MTLNFARAAVVILSRFRIRFCTVATSALALICALTAFAESTRANFLADFYGGVHDFFSGPEVASDQYCSGYAKQAVNDAATAARYDCPFYTGVGRYSTNYNDHYWWCMSVEPATSRGESTTRQPEVNACQANVGYCRIYGQKAARAAQLNNLFGCGYSGAMWEPSERAHTQFCINAKRYDSLFNLGNMFMESETSKRDAAVSACRGQYNTKDILACEGYASRAVSNAGKYRELKCEYRITSQRWDLDYGFHFRWCIDPANASQRQKADQSRITKLAACEARGGGEEKLDPVKSIVANPKGARGKSSSGPGTGNAYYSKPADNKNNNNNAAMDRLGGGSGGSNTLGGSPGSGSPGARAKPCSTCGKATPTDTTVRPSVITAPKPAPAPSVDALTNFGGCAGCGKGKFTQPR